MGGSGAWELVTARERLLGAAREKELTAVVPELTKELIAETLAIMVGLSADGAAELPQAPPYEPAGMTEDDREVWALA